MDIHSMEHSIAWKYGQISSRLNERSRRQWAATEAVQVGRGGIACVVRATKLARNTVKRGIAELGARRSRQDALAPTRSRIPGGGRKSIVEKDPTILVDVRAIVEPETRGDPESFLRWTSKSARKISVALQQRRHIVSERSVWTLLRSLGYSMKSNSKDIEGKQHPDRDAQFRHINATVGDSMRRGQPVLSIDAKKRELVGNFKNRGREWTAKGKPTRVSVHDFPDEELGKVTPYGIYDFKRNEGWVNVGISGNTAAFAVESIRRWWKHVGQERYPDATELLLTADSGGSNAARTRLWKVELQQLADETGLTLHVLHFPPGTSKWNKIEHRLFCYISMNWRGRPLISRGLILQLIGSTTTEAGLTVRAMLDENTYPTGIKITDEKMAGLCLEPEQFHGDWNYRIRSRRKV